MGFIPWTAINEYAQTTGLHPIEDQILYDDMVFFIEELDKVFMKNEADKANASKTKKSNTNWG